MSQKRPLTSWGCYPVIESETLPFYSAETLKHVLKTKTRTFIPRGNGRSYGDCALAPVVGLILPFNRMLAFDETTGLLTCEAGVLLSEIIEIFLPRGWFLKVTPGTKLITVGGAIAGDVHGKNHHVSGCFSSCVKKFDLMLADGQVVTCSPAENCELFFATCGGMGLTGIVLQASFYLQKVHSQFIEQTTIKTRNLKETFEAFENYAEKPYSVAWIDSLSKGDRLGRSLFMVGDFANDDELAYRSPRNLNVPFNLPRLTLNRFSVKLFNSVYYGLNWHDLSKKVVSVDSFFYPLDAIGHWNRIYGKTGFIQYQFVLPKANSFEGLEIILLFIIEKGLGSFLSVLKLHGPANDNYLSFPLEGYSLALDFRITADLFPLLDRLDEIVNERGGRIYLSKDVRAGRDAFECGYPQVDTFRKLRLKYQLNQRFQSLQSQRLEL